MELDQRPAKVSPPRGNGPEVYLNWEQAVDDEGYLRCCPACGCKDLFARNFFPRVTAFIIVMLAAVMCLILLGFRQIFAAVLLLGTLCLVDALIYFFSSKCLVCYRCRSEFRKLPIRKKHPAWNPVIGEKYRQIDLATDEHR